VVDQPTSGDGWIGGRRGEHQPRWQATAEQRLECVAAVLVGLLAQVGAAVGEQVEHHVCRRSGGGEGVGAAGTGAQPVLQGGEVEPARVPDHHFPVEHDLVVEPADRGGDVGEVGGQDALLA
jgi:hypothetical protein